MVNEAQLASVWERSAGSENPVFDFLKLQLTNCIFLQIQLHQFMVYTVTLPFLKAIWKDKIKQISICHHNYFTSCGKNNWYLLLVRLKSRVLIYKLCPLLWSHLFLVSVSCFIDWSILGCHICLSLSYCSLAFWLYSLTPTTAPKARSLPASFLPSRPTLLSWMLLLKCFMNWRTCCLCYSSHPDEESMADVTLSSLHSMFSSLAWASYWLYLCCHHILTCNFFTCNWAKS